MTSTAPRGQVWDQAPGYGSWRPAAGFLAVALALYGVSGARPVVPLLVGVVAALVWAVAAGPLLFRSNRYPGTAAVVAVAIVGTALVFRSGSLTDAGLVAGLLALALAGAALAVPYRVYRRELVVPV